MAYEETYQQGPSGEMSKVISREKPDVPESRSALVNQWQEKVRKRRDALHEKEFKRMREDMDFTEGYQVDGQTAEQAESYVANLCISHVNDRVATLYAKNPKAIAKRVPRLDSQVWDGKSESVAPVDQRMAMAVQSAMQPSPEDLAFMAAVADVLNRRKMIDGVGKTLEILFNYYMKEGIPPFKTSAKQLVRRTETCGVGYVKLGFQRVMEKNAEVTQKIADFSDQLAHIEALAADMADDQFQDNDARAESLKQAIQALQEREEVISREGLIFDFPESQCVIPGPGTKHIRGFVGAPWIAEEHIVLPQEIQELFGVDIGSEFTQFKDEECGDDEPKCRWFEIYDLKAGVLRHVVEGYCDFLEEPKAPPVFFEQGHPYFALTFNNLESRKTCYPPSDVRLMRPMQLEINRSEESLRRHRIANRPGYTAPKGLLDEQDLMKFGTHADSEIMEMKVPAGTDMSKAIAGKPTIAIDPMLYDTSRHFVNMQRVTKSQESNFGGVQGDVTATGASIAEQTRLGNVSSNKDDLDDFLTAVARASGQLLLASMSIEQVQKIAGEGAVWPELSREQIAEEIYLEIKAGSSGAPNQAQELANAERALPTLLQIPGISPKKLAGYVLERLELGIDLDEWLVDNMPSITAINAMSKAAAPPGQNADPEAQGDQGANNAPTQPGPMGAQPMFPAPGGAPRDVSLQ